jgi:hypothetical protein
VRSELPADLAVQRPGPRYSDILLVKSVDKGGIVHAFNAFPTRIDSGEIEAGIRVEPQRCPLRNVKIDIANWGLTTPIR